MMKHMKIFKMTYLAISAKIVEVVFITMMLFVTIGTIVHYAKIVWMSLLVWHALKQIPLVDIANHVGVLVIIIFIFTVNSVTDILAQRQENNAIVELHQNIARIA
ncbi:MAG: hypothetical protein J6T78_05255 [Bacteroidaceae bacterium]|nr:hypothetical protein [Bacteroidaceae bacterium]